MTYQISPTGTPVAPYTAAQDAAWTVEPIGNFLPNYGSAPGSITFKNCSTGGVNTCNGPEVSYEPIPPTQTGPTTAYSTSDGTSVGDVPSEGVVECRYNPFGG